MSSGAHAPETTGRSPVSSSRAAFGFDAVAVGVAVALAALFVAIALPVLATLPHDFDEGWFMLDARAIQHGQRPFVDFAHHEVPLHLHALSLFGRVFGATPFGYRLLSLVALAASGVALFWLARPFVGAMPALVAEAAFLFSPVQSRALTAVPETPALLCLLVATVLLYTRESRRSAWASGAVFVLAVLLKPQYLVVAAAAALSLVVARQWQRLADFAAAGVLAVLVGVGWVVLASDGIVLDVARFQLTRVTTHRGGMWSIDSGFADMRRLLGVETPRQWAVIGFQTFFQTRVASTPLALFVLGLLAIPVWVVGCARARPALAAFVVLWPASLLVLNFALMDFASPRYFIPYAAFAAFLLSAWVWLAERALGTWTAGALAAVAGAVLVGQLATTLGSDSDPWFWGRSHAIAEEHARVVSFNPILFAATGTEPGCGLANAALTYGSFGAHFLAAERLRRFRIDDDDLIACLRADPAMPVVIDWAFYFFTRPGSRLREYLAGEGSAQRLYFSPDAVQQWDRPLLRMSPLR